MRLQLDQADDQPDGGITDSAVIGDFFTIRVNNTTDVYSRLTLPFDSGTQDLQIGAVNDDVINEKYSAEPRFFNRVLTTGQLNTLYGGGAGYPYILSDELFFLPYTVLPDLGHDASVNANDFTVVAPSGPLQVTGPNATTLGFYHRYDGGVSFNDYLTKPASHIIDGTAIPAGGGITFTGFFYLPAAVAAGYVPLITCRGTALPGTWAIDHQAGGTLRAYYWDGSGYPVANSSFAAVYDQWFFMAMIIQQA